MRLSHMFVMSIVLGSGLAACGDDGGSGPAIDAPVAIDAAPDAPAALAGLGQICSDTMACPTNAPVCIVFSQAATQGFCSQLCFPNAQFMTNATSQVTSATDTSTMDSVCTAIYTGNIGTASCFLPLDRTPTGALAPNTTYTFQAHCQIDCGTGNTCPTGLTCDTQLMLCQP